MTQLAERSELLLACYERPMTRASVLLLGVLLVGCASSAPAGPALAGAPPAPASAPSALASDARAVEGLVDGRTARELVKGGARLLDVRTPEEFQAKHVEGAENVPVDTIPTAEVGPKDAAVVVYCGSGKRSARAAAALRAKGHTKVYDLGGMSNWDK